MQDIHEILGSDGPLARHLEGFTPRRAQLRMAEAVASALARREHLVVEAGTGTGKTFAYLVPALLGGQRVLISTGTRTLQDQLFTKDVPLVASALGAPAKIALLKGRSNYLCIYRMKSQVAQGVLAGIPLRDPMLARIQAWSNTTSQGDLSEIAGLTDAHSVWPLVTSTRDNCLGQRCSDYAQCHVVAARREAQEADIVIVNHHLLLADLALKEDGFGDLLGSADAIILDEAHQLPDLATQFFGVQASSRQVEHVLTDGRAVLLRAGGSLAEIGAATREVEVALGAVLASLPRAAARLRWEECTTDLESLVLAVVAALRIFTTALERASREPAVELAAKRATDLAHALERIALCGDDLGARTMEANGHSFILGLLPFDIAARFDGLLRARPAAWIFTSATLSIGEDFAHFVTRLGLHSATQLHIPSPFDFENQALLYLPKKMPDPTEPGYIEALIETALPLLDASAGGAFLLFTSHRALAQAATLLRAHWDGAIELRLLVQGESPREQLLREFREHGNAVLLGTASFWEGVDVKGAALRLVIIEKLPFASPEDPLVKARIDFLRRRGENPFRDYQLPEAVLALKQGVGRLIRSEEDRGMIVIFDPRLMSKGYGRMFRASLPPMPITQEPAEALRFLKKLERT